MKVVVALIGALVLGVGCCGRSVSRKSAKEELEYAGG